MAPMIRNVASINRNTQRYSRSNGAARDAMVTHSRRGRLARPVSVTGTSAGALSQQNRAIAVVEPQNASFQFRAQLRSETTTSKIIILTRRLACPP